MTLPVVDFSPLLTVDNTTFDDTHKYEYVPKSGMYLLVREISVAGDSIFLSDGKFKMNLNGAAITSEGGALNEVQPQTNFSVRFSDDDCIFVEPSEKLRIDLKVTSGSAKVQTLMTGVLMTELEYQAFMKRKGLM